MFSIIFLATIGIIILFSTQHFFFLSVNVSSLSGMPHVQSFRPGLCNAKGSGHLTTFLLISVDDLSSIHSFLQFVISPLNQREKNKDQGKRVV